MRAMLVLMQLGAVMNELSARITRRSGLTSHDLLVLGWMSQQPGISATDAAARIGRARQSVQRTLERLEWRGLAERRESVIRDRTSGWGLTSKGQEQWEELERAFSAQESELKHLGVRVTRFVDELEKLVIGMTQIAHRYPRLGLTVPEPEEEVPEWDL